ncbi:hypothetical protein LTR66_002246 [Elasticomyces elasticus]|nr:hypothetical protein LTR28_002987 [Elasticomyces elasticus]KAK4998540.1 hypothetical protein LTR66_002246 [Elasticomyces elasticus]
MSANFGRYEILRRLGIEQLPALVAAEEPVDEVSDGPFPNIPLTTMPVPGRRCPACALKGQTVWVIPGKRCPQCGTPVR